MRMIITSDTHNGLYKNKIPKGDMFIHCGDLSITGTYNEIDYQLSIMSSLPHKYKIWIAGNHDILLEKEDELKTKYKNLIYLEDELIEVEGIKIFGSPWSPFFNNWAFMLEMEEEIEKYLEMPKMDILISHGAPINILDKNKDGINCGSYDLRERVFELMPKYHFFGHIHEGYGMIYHLGPVFVNASAFDYYKENPPVVIDY